MDVPRPIIFQIFISIAISAPMLGVALGGCVIHKVGGYETMKAMDVVLICAIWAALCAIPIPLMKDLGWFILFMWLFLFFGGGLLPGLSGFMLTSVPKELRYYASAFNSVTSNLLGYLPSPFLYGLIWHYTGGDASPYGLMINMYWSFFMCILLISAYFIRKRQFA